MTKGKMPPPPLSEEIDSDTAKEMLEELFPGTMYRKPEKEVAPTDFRSPVIVMFPPHILELQQAIALDPVRAEKLSKTCTTFEEVIGELAAEFSIILDGVYTPQDVANLCRLLAKRIRGELSRVIVVNTESNRSH